MTEREYVLAFAGFFTAWFWIEIGRAAHAIWQYCFCAVGLV